MALNTATVLGWGFGYWSDDERQSSDQYCPSDTTDNIKREIQGMPCIYEQNMGVLAVALVAAGNIASLPSQGGF